MAVQRITHKKIVKYVEELHENNVKLTFIGDMSQFSNRLLKNIRIAEELTKNNTNLKLNFAINYGGKWDIVNAFNNMLKINHKSLQSKNITVNDIEPFLSLEGSSADLLIRTAGHQRLSNFMLWQHAYTELYFTKCLWPDFNEKELDLAIKYFQNRNRKYGTINSENKLKKDV